MKYILFTTNDRCPDDLYETFNDSTADLINFFCKFPKNVAYGKQRTTRNNVCCFGWQFLYLFRLTVCHINLHVCCNSSCIWTGCKLVGTIMSQNMWSPIIILVFGVLYRSKLTSQNDREKGVFSPSSSCC